MTLTEHKEIRVAIEAFRQWFDGFISLLPNSVKEELRQYWAETGVVLDAYVNE